MSGGGDLVARLRLEANASQLVAETGRSTTAVNKMGEAGANAAQNLDKTAAADRTLTKEAGAAATANDRLGRELDGVAKSAPAAARGLGQTAAEARQFESSARGASGMGQGLALVLGGLGAREIIGGMKDAALGVAGIQTGLGAVAGGAAGARSEIAFVRDEADRLGLSSKGSAESLLSLSAATNGTILQGAKTREIWLGLNEAGVALNLTNERQGLAMQAISQIASKQVVSQEELRGQLAEALPGAYQVAQRAMGLTVQEFNKLVASGNLMADDFLPKFAAQLRKEFGPAVEQSLTSPLGRARVEIAETGNSLYDLKAIAGTSFLGGLTDGLSDLNDELKDPEARAAAAELGRGIGQALGEGARAIGVFVDHIDEVQLALGALTAVGISRWLVSMTTDLRGSAAAMIAKGQAAALASAQMQAGAAGEARAVTTLRGAVEAGARAELAAATAAREAAIAREALAAATLAQARAQATATATIIPSVQAEAAATVAERELAAAKLATAAASGRAELAEVGLARASTATGAAMTGFKGVASGLLGLLGGPWGIALMAAGGAVAFVSHELAESEKRAREALATQQGYSAAMAEASAILVDAGMHTRAFARDTEGAINPTDSLTGSTRALTDQTLKLADARRQAALAALETSEGKLREERDRIDRIPARGTVDVVVGVKANGDPLMGKMMQAARRDQINSEIATLQAAQIGLMIAKPTATATASPPRVTAVGKADRQAIGAEAKAQDLSEAIAAQDAYRIALRAGGAALDDWKAKEAGRQAVERLALADRPKLNAAEQALVATIKTRAEETARLKLADERMGAAIGLRKTMEADTAALARRAAATALGEKALEELQVTEAGLQALQRIGVDTLNQLTGAALAEAKAAMASAEARERQAIATEKADRVANSLRSMDKAIADERAHTVALQGGTKAQTDYARAEFARQEIERAGETLTADQIAAIREKAEALFALQAATAASSADVDLAEELRLSQLTNRERETEIRLKDRARLLQAQKKDLTEEEATAQARLLTLQAMEAEERARAIGDLKESLKQTFIESGKLGFDQIGDYAEKRLREAVYNALLAEPIDIIINAVVGSLSGLGGGAAGSAGGVGGLGSLLNGSGALAGLTAGVTTALTKGLSSLGVGASSAAKYGALGGTALGGAGTGMLVSSLAGMLGLKQTKGNQIGGTIGGAIGSFIPIPGGTLIGSVLGNLVGGLVGGKKSNEAAVLDLDRTGAITSIGGDKRTDATTTAAKSIASAVAQIQAALVAGGATLGATISKIDIGQRDSTHLGFSDGSSIDTAVGDVSAAVEAATKAILANAKWATQAQTDYAQKMIAAGASLDQVVATLGAAGGFSASIDAAISKLVDPVAYEKKTALDAIESNYQALKAQAEELIGAGLVGSEVLGKLEQLRDLDVADTLKRLGGAADTAAEAVAKWTAADAASLGQSIADTIAKIQGPVEFERAQSLKAIEESYQALRTQALEMVAAGLIGGDVLTKLEEMRDLQVAASISKLGDAASDAEAALRSVRDTVAANQQAAIDITGQISGGIAQLLDPVAYERQAALAAIEANYQALRDQALGLIKSGDLAEGALGALEQLRDLQIADSITRLGNAAGDAAVALEAANKTAIEAAEAAAAKAVQGATFGGSIGDAILALVDPVAAKQQAAVGRVAKDYDSRRTEATSLLSGAALAAVLGQIETLRSLELDQVMKDLADQAKTAADALADVKARGETFGGSIQDQILALVDPEAFKAKSATDKVQADYQGRQAQARELFTGDALAGVLGQIETLRTLELDQVMKDLTGAVTVATDAFAEARPRLRSWLDGLVGSNTNGLNADAELQLAREQYDRQIAKAQGGDADALSSITSYADRLLQADREATTDATARRALYELVTGQIESLTLGGAASSAANDNMAASLTKALASQPVNIANLPVFAQTLAAFEAPQTDRVVAAIETMRSAVTTAVADLAASGVANAAALQAALEAGLNAIDSSFGAVAATGAQQAQALDELQKSQQLASVYMRQQRASA